MKKTLTINLNGTVFNIDEDAYELLDEYLRNLRIYFRKEDGSEEIMADFEARIAELFNERMRLGHQVISIEQVKDIIEKIGNPEDFGVSGETEEASPKADVRDGKSQEDQKVKKKLYRNADDKMLGGVCSGISAYFGWDPTPFRIIVFVLIFVTSLWIIPVYLIAWMLIPVAATAEQKLEMRGEKVTLENIGKTVSEPVVTKKEGFVHSVLDFLVAVIKVFAVGVGCLIGIPLIFALVIVVIVLLALLFGFGTAFLPFGDFGGLPGGSFLCDSIPLFVSVCFLLGIPLVALVYRIVAYFGKFKPVPSAVRWVAFVLWIASLVVFITVGTGIVKEQIRTGKWVNTYTRNWDFKVGTNDSDAVVVDGNGVMKDIEQVLPAFRAISLNKNFFANVRLIQSADTAGSKIQINGDENLVDKIGWEVKDETLRLFVKDKYILHGNSGIIVKVTGPRFEKVKIPAVGSVTVDSPLHSDFFELDMDGAGKFRSDSLYVKKLDVSLEGVGTVSLGGKAVRSEYELEGTGKIDALDLESDTVFVRLDGIGSVKSNPVTMLDAKVEGIGKITYKSEPKVKNTKVRGMGKIGKE